VDSTSPEPAAARRDAPLSPSQIFANWFSMKLFKHNS
jgi:hypothetical protein